MSKNKQHHNNTSQAPKNDPVESQETIIADADGLEQEHAEDEIPGSDKEFAQPAAGEQPEPGTTREPASPEAAATVTKIEAPGEAAAPAVVNVPDTFPAKHVNIDLAELRKDLKEVRAEEDLDNHAKVADILAGENPFKDPSARIAYEEMKDYLTVMGKTVGPGRKLALSAQQGAVQQAGLYRALMGAINAPAEEFDKLMTLTLNIINLHQDDVFAAQNIFRFMTAMTLPPATIAHFRHVVNMFTTLAEPKSRSLALRQVDFQLTLNFNKVTEAGRQRVLSYFGVR